MSSLSTLCLSSTQVPDVDVVIIPVGGAGLIAGMSLVFKTLRPDVEVIGIEPENVAS